MTQSLLTIRSPSLKLRPITPSEPYSALYGGWTFTESIDGPHYRKDDHQFFTYSVIVQRPVELDEDPGNVFIEGRYLARDLTRAWVYATGLPLGDRGYDLFFSRVALPTGWSSNAQTVVPADDWSLLDTDLSWTGIYRTTPALPLPSALTALAALHAMPELVQDMASYHFAALEAREPSLHLLLFAQGLSIARELLPGDTDDAKERALPPSINAAKRRPLHWLFGVSNIRRQTRHTITKQPALALHPDMDEPEAEDYQHDADLLLRFVASRDLGLPFILQQNGISTAAT